MIKELLEKLEQNALHLSAVESLTGGLFAASITAIPGASKTFVGGAITYCNEEKVKFGVKKETLENFTAVSTETAQEMVTCCQKKYGTEVAVSFTGNAGPDPSEGKPVGLVFISISIVNNIYNYQLKLGGTREQIRRQSVNFAIETLYNKLLENYSKPRIDKFVD